MQNRQLLGARLKTTLQDLGLTPESAARMLHVTPRTVRYWISGKVLVPYAAYRLLRILRGAELPSDSWDGWHMHSGKLWSPEGFGFVASDSSWWNLLVRKAANFKALHAKIPPRSWLLRAGSIGRRSLFRGIKHGIQPLRISAHGLAQKRDLQAEVLTTFAQHQVQT